MLTLLTDESLVKLCPSCARTFNIARRKHHCRLCGSVMCQDCSQFVDFNFCRKLINPSNLSSYKMGEQHRPGVSRGGGQVSAHVKYFSRDKIFFESALLCVRTPARWAPLLAPRADCSS